MHLDERVRARLATATRFGTIEVVAVTDSTNRVVAERAAAGAPEGLVVAADLQTAGRGRLDRTWEAAPGMALLVSVLLRPDGLPASRRHLVTAAAGLAARQACTTVAGVTPELKWPNDLLLGGAKLAGILAEASGSAVVVGMGCNVHGAPPEAIHLDRAAGHRIGRGDLLAAWLTALDGLLGRWDEVAARYGATCATVGRRVTVDAGGTRLAGRVEGIDADGRLVVRTDDGLAVPVAAGDVTHLRPSAGEA